MAGRNDRELDTNKIEEVLRDSLNTIGIIAVLIATVSFAAGISPPGGVNPAETGMEFKGTSVVGQTTAFKIFIINNEIALFSSLVIVVVLVSVIPINGTTLSIYYKVLRHAVCVSVAFMAVAYVAAMWIIIPRTGSTQWIIVLISVIGGVGTIILISVKVIFICWLKLKSKCCNGNGANGGNGDNNGNGGNGDNNGNGGNGDNNGNGGNGDNNGNG